MQPSVMFVTITQGFFVFSPFFYYPDPKNVIQAKTELKSPKYFRGLLL